MNKKDNIENKETVSASRPLNCSTRRYASIKKARKVWICSICGCNIKPGDQYEFSYAYGGLDIWNKCLKCIE